MGVFCIRRGLFYFSHLAKLFYPKEGSISFCKTVVPVSQTTWHHNTEDPVLNIHCRDNLNCHISSIPDLQCKDVNLEVQKPTGV